MAAYQGFYRRLSGSDEYSWMKWVSKPKAMARADANAFILSVMLDQGQRAERAWKAGLHLSQWWGARVFWAKIRQMPMQELRDKCRSGYDGKSYALRFQSGYFPAWLRKNAVLMAQKYDDDPRRIWSDVTPESVHKIYTRMREFAGIGEGLAAMAQFILVRNHGIAGGSDSQGRMCIKADSHVTRVVFRLGLADKMTPTAVTKAVSNLHLPSPADFDAACWIIGRTCCKVTHPLCEECALASVCPSARIEQ